MSYKNKKRSKVLGFVLLGLMALLVAMTAIVLAGTAGKGMLPTSYIIIILAVVGAIIVVSLFALKRKWSNIVMIIISGAACAVMIYGALFTGEFNKTIDKITDGDGNVEEDTLGDVFTLYISGIDTYGDPNSESRSDVNIIAVVNRKTKHIQLINTPRDAYVYLPNSGDMKDKLTHAGIYGIDTSIETLENLYGIDIDAYMRVNFTGFQDIIDAIGGIDVYSDYDFTVTGGGYSFVKGMNHMDGTQALAFTRERKAFEDGDNQRGRDQMKVIEATVNKLTSSGEMLTNYKGVLSSMSESMQTTVPGGTIYALVNQQLSDSSGWKIDSYAITGEGTYADTFSMPGSQVYVMIPDEDSVEEAKNLIKSVQNEQ